MVTFKTKTFNKLHIFFITTILRNHGNYNRTSDKGHSDLRIPPRPSFSLEGRGGGGGGRGV